MSAINSSLAAFEVPGIDFSATMQGAARGGPRELTLAELEQVGGGIDWGRIGEAATIGAVSGAVGGAVTGGITGSFFGGIGAGPGALLGAGLGAVGGGISGGVGSFITLYVMQ